MTQLAESLHWDGKSLAELRNRKICHFLQNCSYRVGGISIHYNFSFHPDPNHNHNNNLNPNPNSPAAVTWLRLKIKGREVKCRETSFLSSLTEKILAGCSKLLCTQMYHDLVITTTRVHWKYHYAKFQFGATELNWNKINWAHSIYWSNYSIKALRANMSFQLISYDLINLMTTW